MFRKLTLAAAAGAGYVLGAKAGKERYVQIEAKFREIAGMPAVQNATATVKETAASVADTAKTTVNDKVGGGSSDTGSSSGTASTSSTGVASTGTSAVTGTPGGAPLETDVVVVDLGTGANTGATPPLGGTTTTTPLGGARPSDTV